MKDLRIVGISGLPRSGKDSLAELFMANNFFGFSIGDVFREESRSRHADDPNPISVANMTETANWLRTEHGPDFALREALNRYEKAQTDATEPYDGLVVYSVRAPIEADFIVRHGGQLIWVEAADDIRHARYLQHMRDAEAAVSLAEMKAQEALQMKPQPGTPEEVQMNMNYVKSKATHMLENNGNNFEVFKAKATELMHEVIVGSGT